MEVTVIAEFTVRVTGTLTAGLAGVTASLVVVATEKSPAAAANAVARLLASTDPSPEA